MQNKLRFSGDAPILIDGSNVVLESKRYGWRVLKTLLDWLKDKGVSYFLYFDANILHKVENDEAGKAFIKAQISDESHAQCCPGGTQADEYILLQADNDGNHIISNDSYRDFVTEYPWINAKRETGNRRVHRFMVRGDILSVADLRIWEKIDADIRNMVKIEELHRDIEHSNLYILEKRVASSTAKLKELHEAAEQGDSEAQYRLGLHYYVGKSGEPQGGDLRDAEKWLRRAMKQGHAKAQRALGDVQCFLGVCAGDRNQTEAVWWYRRAAEHGNDLAQYSLGRCYYNGEGVAKNLEEAIKWYRKAAEQGYGGAQRDLGLCYCMGKGVAQDLEAAEKWWRKMIEQGDGSAKSTLERYSSAAEQGDAIAQYQMGKLYSGGEVENLWLAAKWFRCAAEQGNAEAQYELGELCNDGFNIWGKDVNDESEATEWYRKAAEQGHAGAQYKLGECYNYGWGIAENSVEAVKWYRKAAKHGHEEAIRMRWIWDK